MPDSFPCPRCNRRLRAAGDLVVDGVEDGVVVFQCDECIEPVLVEGESFEAAYTFGVNAEGKVVPVDAA